MLKYTKKVFGRKKGCNSHVLETNCCKDCSFFTSTLAANPITEDFFI